MLVNLLIIVGLILCYFLAVPIVLIYLACILAFLLRPLNKVLENLLRIRWLAAVFSVMVFVVIVYLLLVTLIPALYNQIFIFGKRLENLRMVMPNLMKDYIKEEVIVKYTGILQDSIMNNVNNIGAYLLNIVSSQGISLAMFSGRFYLVIVMSFYILKDWNKFESLIVKKLPDKYSREIINFFNKIMIALKDLIQGQIKVVCILICSYSIMFSLLGFKDSVFLGILAGSSSFVPYLGMLFSSVFIGIYTFNMDPSLFNIVALATTLIIGNMTESSMLVPYFIGQKLRVHPILLIFYLLSLGALFGVPGIMLALPTSVVIHVVLQQLFNFVVSRLERV